MTKSMAAARSGTVIEFATTNEKPSTPSAAFNFEIMVPAHPLGAIRFAFREVRNALKSGELAVDL